MLNPVTCPVDEKYRIDCQLFIVQTRYKVCVLFLWFVLYMNYFCLK